MIRFSTHLFAVCLGISSLAACSSEVSLSENIATTKAAAASLVSSASSLGNSAAPTTGLTRAELDNIITPVDIITLESRGFSLGIAKIETNRGVETWSTADKRTVALRGGVIVGTRGMGEDLVTAITPSIAQLRSGSANYQRVHVVLDGNDQPVRMMFNCSAQNIGAKTITIVDYSYTTRQVNESCTGSAGQFTNEYWFEHSGKLRKSRQWISKTLGVVTIEHLL